MKSFNIAFVALMLVAATASPLDHNPTNGTKKLHLKNILQRQTDYESRCGHIRQPDTSFCSGRWELRDPSIEAWFTTCTNNEFYLDNGNSYSVTYRFQCGLSPEERNSVSGHTCGVIARTPSSSYCYISTLTSGWIGAWTCCT